MFLLDKLPFVLFFLSALNVIKHIWVILVEFRKEEPKEIVYSKSDILFLGLSISFILTIIFTGF
jgi:hypothetical protein